MRLTDLRKRNGLSQKELSLIINVAQNTISQWEQGKRDPDTATLKKLADYFKVSTDYLLGREEDIKNSYDISQEDIDLLERMKKLPEDKRKAMELLLGFAENVEEFFFIDHLLFPKNLHFLVYVLEMLHLIFVFPKNSF